MERLWRGEITDPTERRVFEALEDRRWDFRTIHGLAASTRLSEEVVRKTLNRYPQFIRRSPLPDTEGRELYTLVSRGRGLREWYRTTRAFITKSTA